MNCPHCQKTIHAFTGLQELQKFQKHLGKCRKNPANIISDGKQSISLGKSFSLMEALKVRSKSGQ